MGDFLIQIGTSLKPEAVEQLLQQRPGVEDLRPVTWQFKWGTVTVQIPRCPGYEPYWSEGALCFAVGRPRIMGRLHYGTGPSCFTAICAEWFKSGNIEKEYHRLTGLFAICRCTEHSIEILTDPMGFYPVYCAQRSGVPASIGSYSELVAKSAECEQDVDSVSIAEVLLNYNITFPYTSRRGMTELDPGSRYQLNLEDGQFRHVIVSLWEPKEPGRFSSYHESFRDLTDALRVAGVDLTQGVGRVGVTLSGGIDSRTVLACVPANQRHVAITFADHENSEWAVARKVAQRAKVRHLTAWRDPEFYCTLATRETQLLGIERAALTAHGFAVRDAGLAEECDLLLSGLKSDTLLRGCYLIGLKELLMQRLGLRHPSPNVDILPYITAPTKYAGRILQILRPHIREEVLRRFSERLCTLRRMRPTTADEWVQWYPMSRNEGAAFVLANIRLLPSDELFIHRQVLEVASKIAPLWKKTEVVAKRAFCEIAGDLMRIENSNTGLPASTSWIWERLLARIGRRRSISQVREAKYPWFTEHSWVDYQSLQQHSPLWKQIRQQAATCPEGLDMLAEVLSIHPRTVVEAYGTQFGPRFNYTTVQLLLHLDSVMNPGRSDAIRWNVASRGDVGSGVSPSLQGNLIYN